MIHNHNTKRASWLRGLGFLTTLLLFFSFGCIIGSRIFSHTSSPTEFAPAAKVSDLLRFPTTCNATIPAALVYSQLLETMYGAVSPYERFPPAEAKPLLRKQWLKGWDSHDAVFQKLIFETKPRVIIEVGTFLGTSAIHMGYLSLEMELNTTILCIDDFRAWPDYRVSFGGLQHINGQVVLLYQFLQNVLRNGLQGRILPVPFSSVPTLQAFCKWGVSADLIELDASHDFHSTWMDINLAYPLLTPEGVMFGHGYLNEKDDYGVQRAVLLFAQIHKLRVVVDEQHWILRSK